MCNFVSFCLLTGARRIIDQKNIFSRELVYRFFLTLTISSTACNTNTSDTIGTTQTLTTHNTTEQIRTTGKIPAPPPRTLKQKQPVPPPPNTRHNKRSFRFFRGDSVAGCDDGEEDSLAEYCRSHRAQYDNSQNTDQMDTAFENALFGDVSCNETDEAVIRRLSNNSEEDNNGSNMSNSSGRHSTVDTIDTISSNNSNINSFSNNSSISKDSSILPNGINSVNQTSRKEIISSPHIEEHHVRNIQSYEETDKATVNEEGDKLRLQGILLQEQLHQKQVESLLPPVSTHRRISMDEVLDSLLALPSSSRSQSPANLDSESDEEMSMSRTVVTPPKSDLNKNLEHLSNDTSDDDEFQTPRETMSEITSRLSEEVSKMLPSELSQELSKELSSKLSSRFLMDIPDPSEMETVRNSFLEEYKKQDSPVKLQPQRQHDELYKMVDIETNIVEKKQQVQGSSSTGGGLLAELTGVLARRKSGSKESPSKPSKGQQNFEESQQEKVKEIKRDGNLMNNEQTLEKKQMIQEAILQHVQSKEQEQIGVKEHEQQSSIEKQPPKPPERQKPIKQEFATFSRLDASQRKKIPPTSQNLIKSNIVEQKTNEEKLEKNRKSKKTPPPPPPQKQMQTKQRKHQSEKQRQEQELEKKLVEQQKEKEKVKRDEQIVEKKKQQKLLNDIEQKRINEDKMQQQLQLEKEKESSSEPTVLQSPSSIPAFAHFSPEEPRTECKLRYSYDPNTARRRPRPKQKLEDIQQHAQEKQKQKILEKVHENKKTVNTSGEPPQLQMDEQLQLIQQRTLQQQQQTQKQQQTRVPGEAFAV